MLHAGLDLSRKRLEACQLAMTESISISSLRS